MEESGDIAAAPMSAEEYAAAMVADVDIDPRLFMQALETERGEERGDHDQEHVAINRDASNDARISVDSGESSAPRRISRTRKPPARMDLDIVVAPRKRARDVTEEEEQEEEQEEEEEDAAGLQQHQRRQEEGEDENEEEASASNGDSSSDEEAVSGMATKSNNDDSNNDDNARGASDRRGAPEGEEKKAMTTGKTASAAGGTTKGGSRRGPRPEAAELLLRWPDGSVDERVSALKEAMRRVVGVMLPAPSIPASSAATATHAAASTGAGAGLIRAVGGKTALRDNSAKVSKSSSAKTADASGDGDATAADSDTGDAVAVDPALERLGELARGMQRYLFAGGSQEDILQLEALLHAAVHWDGVTAAALASPQAGTVAKDLKAASKGRGGRTRITEAAVAVVTAWRDALSAADATSGGSSLLAAAAKHSGTTVVMLKT